MSSSLPEPYYRARRNLTIASTLLLTWEYLGIGPRDPQTAEATVKMPLAGTEFAIRHHSAIPLVVFVVTLFLMARFVVEWRHIDPDVRSKGSTVADLWLTTGLFVIAVGVYLIQLGAGIYIAPILESSVEFAIGWFIGSLFAVIGTIAIHLFFRVKEGVSLPKLRKPMAYLIILSLVLLVFLLILYRYR